MPRRETGRTAGDAAQRRATRRFLLALGVVAVLAIVAGAVYALTRGGDRVGRALLHRDVLRLGRRRDRAPVRRRRRALLPRRRDRAQVAEACRKAGFAVGRRVAPVSLLA